MTQTIEIARYPQHEMAFIILNGKRVFTGNYWDFKDTTHGAIIAGIDLTGKWDSGINSLGSALKSALETKGLKVNLTQKTLTTKEYKSFGF